MDYNVTKDEGGDSVSVIVDEIITTPGLDDVEDVNASLSSSTFANLCDPDLLPSFIEYYTGIDFTTALIVFSLGLLAVFIIFSLYAETIIHILKYSSSSTKTSSVFVLSIYPVVAVASYCVIVVPRSQLISEAVIQIVFMSCLYQLFCLFLSYCDGESGLIDKIPPKALNLRVAPCCCWPCCFCLTQVTLTKKRLNFLRLIVLQLPIMQGLCYLAQMLMWSEEQRIYHVNYIYIQPVVITSILIGVWGMIMMVRMLAPLLKKYSLVPKYIILQLVLILTKFQTIFVKIPIWSGTFVCQYPMTPALYSNMILNSVLLWEMVFLVLLARIFYKKPIPESYSTSVRSSNLPSKLTTLSEKVTKLEMFKDNNNMSI